jgi:hypothetical protein
MRLAVMITPRQLLLALAASACVGCATTDQPAAPGLQVFKDEYDGSTIARQQPVISGGVAGDWNALGFEWRSKFPNRVVLNAGTRGVVKITEVGLEIDGEEASVKIASELTDYGAPSAAERWSMRRFEISWVDFERMAAARTVRMKIVGANEILVTSFGSAHAEAPINDSLSSFFVTVRKLRGEEPR